MPKIATVTLSAVSPYSQSRAHETPRKEKEAPDAYEQRTWREKAHFNDKGQVFIPPMSFKMALDAAAKYLQLQIPGKGKSTYTKHFASGCLVMDPAFVGVSKDALEYDRIHANADGVRGSGKRVWRFFPRVDNWEVTVDFHVYDDAITKDVFEKVLSEAGRFIGIGRFRPQNGGFYGRFDVEKIKWSEV
jgi:hypothetical protein